MLSTDRKVFEQSSVSARIASYGSITDELLFVVFAAGMRKEVLLAPNVRVVQVGGVNKVFALFNGLLFLLSETAEKRYDVLSSQDPFALGLVGLIVAKLRNSAFQVQLHTDCFSSLYTSESARRMLESLIARFIIPLASSVRAVSQRTEIAARRLTNKTVAVLPLPLTPVSPKTYNRPQEFTEGVFTVLAVSRLTQEKQLQVLIEAIALVRNVELVLVGDGPEKGALMRLIGERGLTRRVRIAGWQDPAPYYAYADVFALVSRYEGYGLAIMEAALRGVPILVTDVGVAGYELKNDMDILMVEGSVNAVAAGLSRLKEDSALRQTLGSAARKKAEAALVSEGDYLARYRQVLMACMQEQTYTGRT